MKIRITFDLDEYTRRGIANNYNDCKEGDNPPADYETCKSWIESIISGETESLSFYRELEPWEIEEQEARLGVV
tara:strand:- start:253 stop:474 length:222 start_codon:yes stop_codon:yes gene_type:complete